MSTLFSKIVNYFKGGGEDYDKSKLILLKTILPIFIIIHHIAPKGYRGLDFFQYNGDIVMYIFFAMSGFGLVISYINNNDYINRFLNRSLPKLFIPYLMAMAAFIIYRHFHDMGNLVILQEKGLYSFVPTSWYIYVLAYFYIFFWIVFRYVKAGNATRVLIVTILVFGYCLIAERIGISPWRWNRCPAFCIGMMAAIAYKYRHLFKKWFLIAGAVAMISAWPIYLKVYERMPMAASMYIATLFFLIIFIIPSVPTNKVTRFISSISLEMFIIQFLPIYICQNNLGIIPDGSRFTSLLMVAAVLVLDIAFAYAMHRGIKAGWLIFVKEQGRIC